MALHWWDWMRGKASGTARVGLVLALGVGGAGCTGLVGSGDDGDGSGNGPATKFPDGGVDEEGNPIPFECSLGLPQAGEERPYRLTARQYENSVRELLGEAIPELALAQDQAETASALAVRKWNEAAEQLVPTQSTWMNAYVDCTLGAGDPACGAQFAAAFAERAFRRPLLADESAWIDSSLATVRETATEGEALGLIAQAILQMPQFLYLYVEGTPIEGHPHGLRRLSGYEIAQRLSYFLWDSLPDAELLAAAADGSLDTDGGVRAQAERMVTDDRAKPVFRELLVNWLEINGNGALLKPVDRLDKDAAKFPEFDANLASAMRTEIEAFMDHVMFEKDGSVETLLTSTRSYVNGPLATLYGVEGGPTGESEWAWVDLNPAQRAGILTRAGFLSVHSIQIDDMHAPIRRGVFMLRKMLCAKIPPPPDNVQIPDADAANGAILSVRDQTAETTSSAACSACHTSINSLGFPFGHYDAIGRWNAKDPRNGGTINTEGNLVQSGAESDGLVTDALDLSSRLLTSEGFQGCLTSKWFEQAVRRVPSDLDACGAEGLRQTVADTGNIRELLLSIVESDAFLNVNHGVGDL